MINSWYCVRTQRYKENWVGRQLLDLGREFYLPLLRERRIVRRQWKDVIEPLFPCYLFVRCVDCSYFRVVSTLFGAVNILSSGVKEPSRIDRRFITNLRNRSLHGYITVQPPSLVAGEELEVVAGPFEGVAALFQQELKAGERGGALVEILSSWVRVDLPRTYVRKQGAHPGPQVAA